MTALIISGGATVVSSGSVFSYNDQPIGIKLQDIEVKGFSFNLKFSFSYDDNDPTPRWTPGKDNSNECCHMELINYNNPLGTGMLSPFLFASNKLGVCYYITFMVNGWERTRSKMFSYTIYRVSKLEEKGGSNNG